MGYLPHPHYAEQDPNNSEVIHFYETHYSDDRDDWTQIGFGTLPDGLTWDEWVEGFENNEGVPLENFVPVDPDAGEGDGDGLPAGGEGDGDELPGDGEGDGGAGGTVGDSGDGDGDAGDGDSGDGDSGDGDSGDGDSGDGASGDGQGDGGQGDGQGDGGGGGTGAAGEGTGVQDSFIAFCKALMEDYESALDNLNDLGEQVPSGGGEDAAAEAIGISEEIGDLAGVLEDLNSETEALTSALGRGQLALNGLHDSVGGIDGGDILSDTPSVSIQQFEEPPEFAETGGEPVALSSGAFQNVTVDLVIPSVGVDFDVTRIYSNQVYNAGSFGAKWDVWFDANVRELSSGLVYLWSGQARGWFLSPDGPNDYDGGVGFRHRFVRAGGGWELRDRTGFVWVFDGDGHLSERRDRFGNFIRVNRNGDGLIVGLEDTNGRTLTVSRDTAERVTEIADWTGRVWQYDYDGQVLSAVTLPATTDHPGGRVIRYSYDSPGPPQMRANLVSIDSPVGSELVANIYGTSVDGFNKVIEQDFAGDDHQFEYEVVNDDIDAEVVNRHQLSHRTTHTDGRGIVHIHEFNVFGGLLETRTLSQGIATNAPSNWRFAFQYDTLLHNQEIVLPGGSILRFNYDLGAGDPLARHDILQIRHVPSDGGTHAVHRFEYGAFGQVTRFEDPLGNVFEIDVDNMGRPTRYTGPSAELATGGSHTPIVDTVYDARGQIVSIASAEGVTHSFEYEGGGQNAGRLVRQRRNGTQIAQYDRDALWRVTGYTDEAGHLFTLQWDAADQVTMELGPTGTHVRRRYRYDEAGSLVAVGERNINENGVVGFPVFVETTFERDVRGRVTAVHQPIESGVSAETLIEWDADNRIVEVIDPEGVSTRWVWDERGLIHERITAAGTSREAVERFAHNLDGLISSYADPNGNARSYAYDGYLHNASMQSPDGTTARWAFDRAGRLTRADVEDGAGILRERHRFDYDALGRVMRVRQRVIEPDGIAVATLANEVAYDRDGHPVALIDADGGRHDIAWNAAEDVVSVTDPSGDPTLFEYDPRGLMTRMTSVGTDTATGATSVVSHSFAHDALGRLTSATDGLGNADRYTYDGRNRLTQLERPAGVIEEYAYDLAGRMTQRRIARVRPNGIPLSDVVELVGYDLAGRPVRLRDGGGNEIEITRDAMGDATRIDLPDFTYAQYEYDAAGNPIRVQDGRGTVVEIDYDGLNRPVRQQVVTAAGALGATDEEFEYDATGNLVRAENASHVVERTFDSLGRLRSEEVDGRTATRTYRANGLPRDLAYPSGFRLRASFDDAHRLRDLSIVSAGSGFPGGALPPDPLLHWDYRAEVFPSRLTTAGGAEQRIGYDAAGRDLEIAVATTAGPDEHLVNLRDGFGRIRMRLRDSLHTTAARYESTGWLSSVAQGAAPALPGLSNWRPTGNSANPNPAGDQNSLNVLAASLDPAVPDRSDDYAYDSRGNRTSHTRAEGGVDNTVSWTYDDSSRVTSMSGASVTSDGAGNVRDDGVHRYSYDHAGRLTRIEPTGGGAALVEISRDALGRAIEVTTPSGTRRRFYAVLDLIEETTATGSLLALYVPGTSIDQPLVAFAGGDVAFAHQDSVGTVFATTDRDGRLQHRYVRDEFGQVLGTLAADGLPLPAGTDIYPFGLQGRDAWTDDPIVVDYRARVMRADWGRFLQPDPLGLAGGANVYQFVGNNPLLYVDPTGELAFLLAGILAGALIGGGVAAWFNRDKSGWDFWVPVIGGAVGGAVMGSGLGLAGFVAGGAISGGIVGSYEGYKAGGVKGAIIGGTFGTVFGGLAGGVGGSVGRSVTTRFTGQITNSLIGRMSGQSAYAVGSYAGAGLGAAAGGGAGGGINGFGNGVGQSLAAGQDVGDSLRNGANATLPGVGYGLATGVVSGVGTKGLMQAGSYHGFKGGPTWLSGRNSRAGVIGAEGEFFVGQSIGQRANTAFRTPGGKIPDFWGRVRAEVKNTAKVPTLNQQRGQLRQFIAANRGAGSDPFQLFLRPGVTPPPRGGVMGQVNAGNLVLRTIPHYAYPALASLPLGC